MTNLEFFLNTTYNCLELWEWRWWKSFKFQYFNIWIERLGWLWWCDEPRTWYLTHLQAENLWMVEVKYCLLGYKKGFNTSLTLSKFLYKIFYQFLKSSKFLNNVKLGSEWLSLMYWIFSFKNILNTFDSKIFFFQVNLITFKDTSQL